MPTVIEGKTRLMAKFKEMSLRHGKSAEATVEYRSRYAVFVHENVQMKWAGLPRKGKDHLGVYWGRPYSPGSSKFLEKACRRLAGQTAKTVARLLRQKRSLHDAVLAAAKDILAASNALVPIDSGKLLLTGNVRVKEGG